MSDFYCYDNEKLVIGRCETVLGAPYYYVLYKDYEGKNVMFFSKFEQLLSYLKVFYERNDDYEEN